MIIQFSHNGKEINLSQRSKKNGEAYKFEDQTTGYRYWNNEKEHKRKFIKQKGLYLENLGDTFSETPKEADLFFWGEWEPQSKFELTGNPYTGESGLPHAIHSPMFSNRGIGRHNTDPFVFGESFYYTNCKQEKTGRGQMMLDLQKDSIILFGSERGKTEFIIDTVFVVQCSETVNDYKGHPNLYPQMLREATINLNGGLENWYKLYKGKMYNNKTAYSSDNSSTFCFFPCKTDYGNQGFERPVIDWQKFKLQKPGAGTVLHEVSYKSEYDFWSDLVAELLIQGFSFGIQLEMPKNNDACVFPEYIEKEEGC